MKFLQNHLDAVLISAPFLVWLLLNIVLKWVMNNKRQASKWAIDCSAIFFIIAVEREIAFIFEYEAIWYLLLFLLFLYSLLAMISYKKSYEVSLNKLTRRFLRICFMLFSITYIGLLVFLFVQNSMT